MFVLDRRWCVFYATAQRGAALACGSRGARLDSARLGTIESYGSFVQRVYGRCLGSTCSKNCREKEWYLYIKVGDDDSKIEEQRYKSEEMIEKEMIEKLMIKYKEVDIGTGIRKVGSE